MVTIPTSAQQLLLLSVVIVQQLHCQELILVRVSFKAVVKQTMHHITKARLTEDKMKKDTILQADLVVEFPKPYLHLLTYPGHHRARHIERTNDHWHR